MSDQLLIDIYPEDAKETARMMGDRRVYQQRGYFHKPGERAQRMFNFNLPDGIQFYPPGKYSLSPASLQVGKYDRLELAFSLQLIPVSSADAKVKAA